jgi:very-short-patch-repair endonuclease
MVPRSQLLRKNATKEERHLWYDFLKAFPVQFNRQKVIGSFIVDFYSDKAKLAIEIDGAQHYEEYAQQYDEERIAFLNGLGITVVRFSNY